MRRLGRALADFGRALWRRFVGWFVGLLCGGVWMASDGSDLDNEAADYAVLVIVAVWLALELNAAQLGRKLQRQRAADDAELERLRNERAAARDASKLAKQLDTEPPGA